MMEMSLIPYGHIGKTIPAVLPHLEICEKLSQGRSIVDDIVRFLFTGRMQLWVIHAEERVHGVVITEVTTYPQQALLTVQYCSMDTGTLEIVDDVLHDTLDRFAKDARCNGIEFIGRSGWRNNARKHGYNETIVMYQKFFEVQQ